jgi:hypothetical protein
MLVRIIISGIVAAFIAFVATGVASLASYLRAWMDVAGGSFCFYVSPVSVSVSVIAGIIAFCMTFGILSRT